MTAALLAIDVQNDFFDAGEILLDKKRYVYEKGALPVVNACQILPAIRHLARLRREDVILIATQDWHPKNHCSFTGPHPKWPVHCLQHSHGAELVLGMPTPDLLIKKGERPDTDPYDLFQDETKILEHLRAAHVNTLFIFGLAYDYCVGETAKGAIKAGYRTILIEDAILGIFPEKTEAMRQTLLHLGAEIITAKEAIERYPAYFKQEQTNL